MKRRRIEREKREKLKAEEQAAEQRVKRRKWVQTVIMIASILSGMLIAGWMRKYHGEHFPYVYRSSGKGSGGYYDPLQLMGLLGGCAVGTVLNQGIQRIMKNR